MQHRHINIIEQGWPNFFNSRAALNSKISLGDDSAIDDGSPTLNYDLDFPDVAGNSEPAISHLTKYAIGLFETTEPIPVAFRFGSKRPTLNLSHFGGFQAHF